MTNDDRNDDVTSHSLLTEETTATKKLLLTTSTGTLPTLPFDLIIEEILYRLPVKLLIQLRCLCKSFNSLISDPKFAKKHLRFSTKRHHLIVNSSDNSQEFLLSDFPISNVFETSTIITQTPPLNYLDHMKYGYSNRIIVCSCDGILCFSISKSLSAILWNPSIRKFNILPPLETSPKILPISLYSFGYDHFINNYKVIVILSGNDKKYEVNVHTLGTDYWRRIDEDFPCCIVYRGSGKFVSGTVNWLVIDLEGSNASTIVSLDLEKELYQKLSHPDLGKRMMGLAVLRDCLCIFARNDSFLDVWVMKEFGNKESWSKLYSVPYCMDDRSVHIYTTPLYISEDDLILGYYYDFQTMGYCYDYDYDLQIKKMKLVVYDSQNGTLKKSIGIQNFNRLMDPKVYIESLISPCS